MSQLPSQYPSPNAMPPAFPTPPQQPPNQGGWQGGPTTIPPRPNGSKKFLIGAVVGALVLVGGGVGLYFAVSGGSSHPATPKPTVASGSVAPKSQVAAAPPAAATAPPADAQSGSSQDANIASTDSYSVALPSGYSAKTSGTEMDLTAADPSVGITISAAGTPTSTAGEPLQTVAGQVASNLVNKLNLQVVAGSESDLKAGTAQDPGKLFKLANAAESDIVVVFQHGQQFWSIVLYGPPTSIDVANGDPVAALSLVTTSMSLTS
ncbi:hypothetical protein CLV47_107174 [Antricoccus suffuscus]|uniref:Flagellar basal body-associated protein FliL n=1 Tax=Antricoccus suffuscus TaxID=1629062 RepID=A0A2T1A0B1_9ACTN|nr:hypothetical protein [Antricoccus suffuscus]PRZ42046.1 hypothetical protein CLV47_107174 [Antricoccus suffuscus]